ncbi:MAG: hypothetical protein PHI48_06245 [Bacteroidales bacterium]|nr:hypothetical protein [Bacteroidales bacterium]
MSKKLQNKSPKDPMIEFMKSIFRDMKEETERVQKLVENGVIEPMPDKEGIVYNIPESKK